MFLRFIYSTTEPHKCGVVIGGKKHYTVRRQDGRVFRIAKDEASTLHPEFRKHIRRAKGGTQ